MRDQMAGGCMLNMLSSSHMRQRFAAEGPAYTNGCRFETRADSNTTRLKRCAFGAIDKRMQSRIDIDIAGV